MLPFSFLFCLASCNSLSDRNVIEAMVFGPMPDSVVMAGIYEQVKTPYKFGAVLKEEGKKVDCPSVFRHGNKWYMDMSGSRWLFQRI